MTTFYPSEGDRIIVTRTRRDGRTISWIGTATEVTEYAETDSGIWVGGWRLTGSNTATGDPYDSHQACTETLERHDQGIRQTVRPATPDNATVLIADLRPDT